jgi:signal transduction histidine kinase
VPKGAPLSRRLLIGSILLGLFVLCDVGLFGWLIFRSLSEREISRVLLETREEAEGLAQQLAQRARLQGEDLYLAVATERETQTYIDSVLRQRDMVRNLEIRDREGKLVYQMQSRETVPLAPAPQPSMASPELGSRGVPGYEEELSERQLTYEVDDLTVPIGEFGHMTIGISREQMEKRVQALRHDLLRQASIVAGVTLGLLLTAYLVIFWLLRRGRALEAQAAEAERMATIGTLAAGLAHEIRNPLNSLSLNMQMLEEDLGGGAEGATRRLLALTRGEIGRLERLVSDFLAYARPRALECRRLVAGSLLEHARELLAGQAAAHRVQLRVEALDAGTFVEGDPQQLLQLILNLAQNALAACHDRRVTGRVTLRAWREGARVAVEVEDNGVGIAPEERERIFEVFYSTRKGGTGLGLAIVQRIAASHGGELELLSTPGEGTRIRLWLPVAAESAQAGEPAVPARPAGPATQGSAA